jgi:hypothetical protein
MGFLEISMLHIGFIELSFLEMGWNLARLGWGKQFHPM